MSVHLYLYVQSLEYFGVFTRQFWNMNVLAYVRHCYKLLEAVFWHYIHPYRFPYSTRKKHTTGLSIHLLHIMTAFRREPCEVLTINAIIVKPYIFYPNIKIIRLKRHYLPLGLLLVLPQWWGDARWREKSASSCFKSRLNARPRRLEVSQLFLADFLPGFLFAY